MSIIIRKSDDPFARVNKKLLSDKSLSFKAKGISSYLLGHPPDWKIQVGDLVKQSTDGKDAVYAGMRELRDAGYLRRVDQRRGDGTIESVDYEFSDSKEFNQLPGLPEAAKQEAAKQQAEKPDLTKKEKTTKKEKARISDEDFLASLKTNPAYAGIDIDRELGKMDAWFLTARGRGRKKTRPFILNWLNKIDQPINTNGTKTNTRTPTKSSQRGHPELTGTWKIAHLY